MIQAAGLEQVEYGSLVAGEHHQPGLHRPALHLDPVIVLGRLFLVDSPDCLAGLLVKTITFDDQFIEDVLFIGNSFVDKSSVSIDPAVELGNALIGEQNGITGGIIGK